jgi:signal transduction histidine kinase
MLTDNAPRTTTGTVLAAPTDESDVLAPRLARTVVVTVTAGFFFGGFVGIVHSQRSLQSRLVAVVLLVVLLLLHLRNCVRRADGRRPRGWVWTLAAQAALTYVPMIWFIDTWFGNAGFLAGALLLLVRPPALGWVGFGLVIAVHVPVAVSIRPTVFEAIYLVIGQAALVGLAVYGVARLADLVAALRAARRELAVAAVARERLRFAQHLNDGVGAALAAFARRTTALLPVLADRPEAVRAELTDGLSAARRALNDARSVAHAHRDDERPVAGWRVADDLTATSVLVLGAVTLTLMIVPLPLRALLTSGPSAGEATVFAVLMTAFLALYLYTVAPARAGGRVRGWRWTFVAAVLLAAAPVPFLGPRVWSVAMFLPGLTLVLLRGRLRWAATAVLVAQQVPTTVWGQGIWGDGVLNTVYTMVWIAERAAITYGFARLADLAVVLGRARTELARVEVARERLRFARDLHDLFGYSLSVVVLKCELAFRLLASDPTRARVELDEGVAVARTALSDVDAVVAGRSRVSLAAELASARATLVAAGIDATVSPADGALSAGGTLPADVDNTLATVLREGVTNVLRHSGARRCAVTVTVADRAVRLCLVNDGLYARAVAERPGVGLTNLTERLDALGGRVDARRLDGCYVLTVEAPLPASA